MRWYSPQIFQTWKTKSCVMFGFVRMDAGFYLNLEPASSKEYILNSAGWYLGFCSCEPVISHHSKATRAGLFLEAWRCNRRRIFTSLCPALLHLSPCGVMECIVCIEPIIGGNDTVIGRIPDNATRWHSWGSASTLWHAILLQRIIFTLNFL